MHHVMALSHAKKAIRYSAGKHPPDSLAGLLLLALCATPPRIDLGYTQRWGAHSAERAPYSVYEFVRHDAALTVNS